MPRLRLPLPTLRWLVLAVAAALSSAAAGQERLIDAALAGATQTLEAALPQLDAVTMGVPLKAYRNALTQRRFASATWGKTLSVQIINNGSEQGLCAGFAAYVTPAIEQGAMSLVICPQFFTPGADALRETTILHEMVHVVAGPDECQAMAFTAHVQLLATGTYQSVEQYWRRKNCDRSPYRLPR